MSDLRNFEISIWTLQDSFITVIESAFNKIKGKTQNAVMTLNMDGTESLTFTIPMKYDLNGELIVNPSWNSTMNGNILVNMRKVKVILNKGTVDEEIHEFVIDTVTERHEKDNFFCDIGCSGLAFFELGKIGYKVSLSSEDFYAEDMEWFKNQNSGTQPIANLQYWVNKFLIKLDDEDDIENNTFEGNKWYYAIQMDWVGYFNNAGIEYKKHTVYETENLSSDYNSYPEKARLVDLEESNFYNLTQNIAETFGVYCKYKYVYDSDYHIIGRVVIFFNSLLEEANPMHITYRSQTDSIVRTLDSTDLITKMYVKTVDDNNELISIIDVADNPTGEDYLLNFDYLLTSGAIDEIQYNYITTFQKRVKEINDQLKPLAEKIADLEYKIIDYEAARDNADAARKLDQERINELDRLLNALTEGTGVLECTAANPAREVLRQDNSTGLYYVEVKEKGVYADTVHIYNTLNFSAVEDSDRLKNEITNARPVYDEFGNLTQMTGITKTQFSSTVVYLTYTYEPRLANEKVKAAWVVRKGNDEDTYQRNSALLDVAETDLENTKSAQQVLLEAKQVEISKFEKIMGSAIREGYWQPETYSDSGSRYVSYYPLNTISDIARGNSSLDYFEWDENVLDGEQDIYYKIGITETKTYYKCIDLSSIWSSIKNNLNDYSFLYYDYLIQGNEDTSKVQSMVVGAGASFQFIKHTANGSTTIFPALLLIGGETYDETIWSNIKANGKAKIGILDITTRTDSSTGDIIAVDYNITSAHSVTNSMWITLDDTYKVVRPRIFVEAMSLKTSEDQLGVTVNSNPLVNYEDYYVTTVVRPSPLRLELPPEEVTVELGETTNYIYNSSGNMVVSAYQITLKNETLAQYYPFGSNRLSMLFTFSNADESIYRDAIGVLRESSVPKVEYEFSYNIFKQGCIKKVYDFLNRIVLINDYEINFNNIRGYISEISLDLDHPWQDSLTIQNYKVKFEDLFTTIFAQTEAMKQRSYLLDNVADAFYVRGGLKSEVIQKNLLDKDLNFAFNNGTLTIDENNGIWGSSDEGVIAFRGGGIFTASEKDDSGNWKWNTGIIPTGINASLITSGQLDTHKINIFAGNKIRFQMNEDGLFGYKSYLEDTKYFKSDTIIDSKVTEEVNSDDIDYKQYVKFDENGLFLIAKSGAYVFDTGDAANGVPARYRKVNLPNDEELKRVSISWDGLRLKNYSGEDTFFAEADTGNLRLKGSVYANAFYVLTDSGAYVGGKTDITNFVRTEGSNQALSDLMTDLENNGDIQQRIDGFITAESESIQSDYNGKIDEVNQTITDETTRITNDYTSKINEVNTTIATEKTNLQNELKDAIDDVNDTIATEKSNVLGDLQDAVDTLNTTISNEKAAIQNDYNGKISTINNNISSANERIDAVEDDLAAAQEQIDTMSTEIEGKITPEVHKGTSQPTGGYKIGDIFFNTETGQQYICTKVSNPRAQSDWTKISTFRTKGAYMTIDPDNGYIDLGASGKIALASTGLLSFVASNNMSTSYLTISPTEVNLFGQTLKMGGGIIDLKASDTLNITGTATTISGTTLTLEGTNSLNIKSGNLNLTGSNNVNITGPNVVVTGTSSVSINSGSGLSIGANSKLDLTSGGPLNVLGSAVTIGIAKNNTLDTDASYLRFYNTNNSWHMDMHADTLDFTTSGKLSMISGDEVRILGTEVLIGATNASGNLDETSGASYIHLLEQSNSWKLKMGADELNIAANGNLVIGSNATLSLVSAGLLKILGTEVKIGAANASSDLDTNASYIRMFKNSSNKWELDMSADNLDFSSTGTLSMVSSEGAKFLSSEVSIGAARADGTLNDSSGASYIHLFEDVNNNWTLNMGAKNLNISASGQLNIGSLGMLSLVSTSTLMALGSEVKIGTPNASGTDLDTVSSGANFIYMHKVNNNPQLEIGTQNLKIVSGGSINMSSGTISLTASGTIQLMSSNSAGLTLSGDGIVLASNKTLTVDTTNFKIKSSSSNTTSSNPYFYLGDTAIDSNPSHYIKMSESGGLQIKGNVELENSLTANKVQGGSLIIFDSQDSISNDRTRLIFAKRHSSSSNEILGTWDNQRISFAGVDYPTSNFYVNNRYAADCQVSLCGGEIAFNRMTNNIISDSETSFWRREIDTKISTGDILGPDHYKNAASIEVTFPYSQNLNDYDGAAFYINSSRLYFNVSELLVKSDTSPVSFSGGQNVTITINGTTLHFTHGLLTSYSGNAEVIITEPGDEI